VKAAIYLRVSSKGIDPKTKKPRQDEANQEPACRQICETRKWEPLLFRERESAVKERPE